MNRQDPASVEKEIRARIAVDAQLLLLAKVSLTEQCTGEMQSQVDAFVISLDARHANPVVIHPTVDVEAAIAGLAKNMSAKIALGEALWALIGASWRDRKDQHRGVATDPAVLAAIQGETDGFAIYARPAATRAPRRRRSRGGSV